MIYHSKNVTKKVLGIDMQSEIRFDDRKNYIKFKMYLNKNLN